jgi:hypothetical protein
MVYKDAKILKLSAWDPYPELLLKNCPTTYSKTINDCVNVNYVVNLWDHKTIRHVATPMLLTTDCTFNKII